MKFRKERWKSTVTRSWRSKVTGGRCDHFPRLGNMYRDYIYFEGYCRKIAALSMSGYNGRRKLSVPIVNHTQAPHIYPPHDAGKQLLLTIQITGGKLPVYCYSCHKRLGLLVKLYPNLTITLIWDEGIQTITLKELLSGNRVTIDG